MILDCHDDGIALTNPCWAGQCHSRVVTNALLRVMLRAVQLRPPTNCYRRKSGSLKGGASPPISSGIYAKLEYIASCVKSARCVAEPRSFNFQD